jgi:hypothetical protein
VLDSTFSAMKCVFKNYYYVFALHISVKIVNLLKIFLNISKCQSSYGERGNYITLSHLNVQYDIYTSSILEIYTHCVRQ